MADRAHIRFDGSVWQLIRKYNGENHKIALEDGRTTCATLGLVQGNDKVVPIVKETADTSTGPDNIFRRVDQTIEGGTVDVFLPTDRLLRTEVIRDMTAQEVTNRGDATLQSFYRRINDDPSMAGFRDLVFRLDNRVRVLEAAIDLLAAENKPSTDLTVADGAKQTKGDFNNFLKARIQDQIDTGQ